MQISLRRGRGWEGYWKRADLGKFQLSGRRLQTWKTITLMGGCDYSIHYAAIFVKSLCVMFISLHFCYNFLPLLCRNISFWLFNFHLINIKGVFRTRQISKMKRFTKWFTISLHLLCFAGLWIGLWT